jgi:hypothetical protein
VVFCAAVLAAFRHHGALNHLGEPGAVFDPLDEPPADESPVAVITSVGWEPGPGFDMQRVLDFAAGVVAVRMSMSDVDGLHAQHSFFFPGVLADDPITVTMWRSQAAMHRFACAGGSHKHQMERHRAGPPADRTSFTRFRVVRSAGSWHGRAPEAWGRPQAAGAVRTPRTGPPGVLDALTWPRAARCFIVKSPRRDRVRSAPPATS